MLVGVESSLIFVVNEINPISLWDVRWGSAEQRTNVHKEISVVLPV